MKRFLLFMLLIPALASSQAITVDNTTYSVPQLINTILINSPCDAATNIRWKTGSNYGSSNGIGYFQNTNPKFPISSGVILSTGDAINAPGPNNSLLNDGVAEWIGDTDLENVLGQAGIPMTSKNATILEFDFTPISPKFSFNFVFASEEYGNFQCQYSDAFAFLLTNTSTGVTTNLAVVPGTNLPISVVTIRDFLYNSVCNSQNQNYFGSFNGGSLANGSATNFNGQTVLMNASTNLTPNTPYHIKLVIADRNDPLSDSAIFIAANSFNIGQDVLGNDLTVANNTAICPGNSYTINSGLNAANYSFAWKKNGVIINGATGPTLVVTQPGNYSLTYNNLLNPCQPKTDDLLVEYYPNMTVRNPGAIYMCNTGASSYLYDLTLNTQTLLIGQIPGTQVIYYNSTANANNSLNPLTSPYSSAGNETIYAKITNPNTGCSVIKNFKLLTSISPIAYQPQDMTACENSTTTHLASFSFNSQKTSILNGQSNTINTVSFYASQNDANLAQNALSGSNYNGLNNTIIYVRVQNATDKSCFSTTSFRLLVNPKSPVDTIPNQIVCDYFTLPTLNNGNYFTGLNGTGTPLYAGNIISTDQSVYIYSNTNSCPSQNNFSVTIVDIISITPPSGTYCNSYVLPTLSYGYYCTQPNGGGTRLHAGDVITSTQTIYTYYVSTVPPLCRRGSQFTVTITPAPVVPDYPNVFSCTSYTLPTIPIGNYYTGANGTGTLLNAGTSITSSQTVYVYYNNGVSCISQDSFEVVIGLQPINNVAECSTYTLPPLTVGNYFTGINGSGTPLAVGTVITSSQLIHVYAVSSTGCSNDVSFQVNISLAPIPTLGDVTSCGGYTLPNLVNGNYFTGTNGTGILLNSGSLINNSQTVYIYISNGNGCSNQKSFKVTVNPIPLIDSRADITICGSYTLTPLTNGNYYTGSNGTGVMLNSGTVISNTQTIYIYARSIATASCYAENSFNINIYQKLADAPADVIACNSYTLPVLTHGNYYSGSGGTGTLFHDGQVITSSQTLYVYVETPRGIICNDENVFNITVNYTPTLPSFSNVTSCDNFILPNLTLGNYYTGSLGTGTILHSGDLINTSQTIYVFVQTTPNSNCYDEKNFKVTIIPHPIANDVPVLNRSICDNDNINDGITDFNLNNLNGYVLGSQIAPEYNLHYYLNNQDALNETGAITSTTQNTVFVRINNSLTPNCYDIKSIFLIVNKLPEPTPKDGFICIDPSTNQSIAPYILMSGLGNSTHSFNWTNSNNYAVGNSNNLPVTTAGNYTVTATNLITGCTSLPITAIVGQSEMATVTYSTTEAFSETQIITVTASGIGNYEYAIDDENYQSSPIFENITNGLHTIHVRDINGCDPNNVNVLIINYPKFFTPNDDSFNDIWNIVGLEKLPNSRIIIYDRYGKLLKQITPYQIGWDGKYNGQLLPSTDYWFTINYTENGTDKEFKAHFSLVR